MAGSIKLLVLEASKISTMSITGAEEAKAETARKVAEAVAIATTQLREIQDESLAAVNTAAKATQNIAVELSRVVGELAAAKEGCASAILVAENNAAVDAVAGLLLTKDVVVESLTNKNKEDLCECGIQTHLEEEVESLKRKLLEWSRSL